MNPTRTDSSAVSRPARILRLAALAAALGGAAVGALAQYKIVGPDGKVTYTDKPPTASDIRLNGNPSSVGNGGGASGMPAETRNAMAKYPVTLYASKNCAPCDQARDTLRQRGVPYNEYSVNTNADINAMQTRFNTTTVPVVAIGTQTIKGYSSNDLQGYLDAAGYPAQAKLTGYRWPQAVALAPPSAEPVASPSATAPSAAAPLLPPPSKSGIQF